MSCFEIILTSFSEGSSFGVWRAKKGEEEFMVVLLQEAAVVSLS